MDAVCVGGKADAAEAPFRPVRTAPSGRTRNAWGGWDAPVTIERLTSFRSVSALYAEAVRKRWIAASEVNAEQFFALARACRRKGKDPAKFFTHCLREQLWDVIAHEDQQAALDAFDKFGRPEPRS